MNIHENVGAYALDSLSATEAAEFEAHLSGCEPCREELASFSVVLEALAEPADAEAGSAGGLAFAEDDVPAGLRDRVFAEIAQTPQDAAPATPLAAATPITTAAGSTVGGSPAEPTNVVPLQRKTRRAFAPRLVAAAAAVIAVAAVGVGVIVNLDGPTQTTEVAMVMDASDVSEHSLGLGDATLWVSASEGVAVTGSTPELPEGQMYQMWVVPADGSAPVPGPVMDGGEADAAWLTTLDGAAAIAVSVEPDGGSTTPTEVLVALEL